MKQIALRYPFASRILLALTAGTGALALGTVIYELIPVRPYFPFVGELLMVLATAALYRMDGQNLHALGLVINRRTTSFLVLGFVMGVAALLLVTWLRTLYTGEVWQVSSSINGISLLKGLYFILPTVVVQELMFRGYLFTRTISRLGFAKANLLFAILFMLIHVLDREVLKSPPQAIMLGICTAIGHLWFAASLRSSGTILFPVGLHWGNNWAVTYMIGAYSHPDSIFSLSHQKVYSDWLAFLPVPVIFNGFYLVLIWLTKKCRKPGPDQWLMDAAAPVKTL